MTQQPDAFTNTQLTLRHGLLLEKTFAAPADAGMALTSYRASLILASLAAKRLHHLAALEKLKALALAQPNHRAVLHLIAELYHEIGKPQGALAVFQEAARTYSSDSDIATDLAGLYRHLGFNQAAANEADRALTLAPQNRRAMLFKADALLNLGKLDDAYTVLCDVLAQQALNDDEIVFALPTLQTIGDTRTIAALGNIPARLTSVSPRLYEPLLTNLLATTDTPETVAAVQFLHNKWGDEIKRVADLLPRLPAPATRRAATSKIRVGFISSDFHNHPMGRWFMELAKLYRDNKLPGLELVCFATAPVKAEDPISQAIMQAVRHNNFHRVHDLDDVTFASAIRRAGIDLLIDLTGHNSGGYVINGHASRQRLGVMALRPAAFQAMYLGSVTTTGMREVDALLVESGFIPETISFFREKFIAIRAPFPVPLTTTAAITTTPPCERVAEGHITFGFLNRTTKLSDLTVALTAATMRQLPTSRLLVVRPECRSTVFKTHTRARFAAHGIDSSRLDFEVNPPGQHLDYYNRIDVILDPAPLSGAASTIEALSMGVPVITLPMDAMHSLQSATYIQTLSDNSGRFNGKTLADYCIATSQDDFVARALAVAGDSLLLKWCRETMRPAMQRAFHTDNPFAKAFTIVMQQNCAPLAQERISTNA